MAKNKNKRQKQGMENRPNVTSAEDHSTLERTMWILGLLILVFSVYLFVAICSYMINWKADCAILCQDAGSIAPFSDTISNICGRGGAAIANMVCGRALGLFGLLVPFILLVFGLHVISVFRSKLNHVLLLMILVAILGSLTLGVAFSTKWDTFSSGLGGAWGIDIAGILDVYVGKAGSWLIIAVAWILTAIFADVKVIDTLTNVGNSTVKNGGHLFAWLYRWMFRKKDQDAFGCDASDTTEVIYSNGEVETLNAAESEDTAEEQSAEPSAEETEDTQPEEGKDGLAITVNRHEEAQLGKIDRRSYDPDRTPQYKFPPIDCLVDYATSAAEVTAEEINSNQKRIEQALNNFGIPITKITASIGPTVTLYEIVQEAGVKISKIQSLENDIAQSLKALGIRIIAPMPGRGTVGIEVPNINKAVVPMRSSILAKRFQEFTGELPIVIGKNIQNEFFVFDLAKMPHLLVAGATGMGKSVGLNAIVTSLLYRKDPAQLKFVLVDPKMVEFSIYKKLERHFLAKMESEENAIITDPKKAVNTLNALCIEMENRLRKCSEAEVRNIKDYNELVRKHEIDETSVMPYIVVIIDEFADLIMMTKEVEAPVMRLAQKARAVGIHLIVATQRPDVKVITGGIKANFPSRIAFRVMQMIDSRTIIDQPGANRLIGKGDMLFSMNGELTRVQCSLVETEEVAAIVDYISKQPSPTGCAYLLPDYDDTQVSGNEDGMGSTGGAPEKLDGLFGKIARDAVSSGQISTSYIQRNYEVGFNRAGRIMTQLERCGIVGPQKGAKPREILYYSLPDLEAKLQELGAE